MDYYQITFSLAVTGDFPLTILNTVLGYFKHSCYSHREELESLDQSWYLTYLFYALMYMFHILFCC